MFAEKRISNFENINLFPLSKSARRFLVLCLLLFGVSVAFKLHGLSIGEWDNWLPSEQYKNENTILGKPRAIRSDEWLVSTPFILSQVGNNYSEKNLNIGPGNTLLLVHYNLPSYHFSSFFRPQNYGFFLFEYERGFSFMWNYKVFGLLISSFFLFLVFTKNNFYLSLTGSFLVYLSSFNQWWFSIPLPDLIIAFNMMVVFFFLFVNSLSKKSIFLYAFGVIYFFINFALILYPPFQIVLGYLFLFLAFIIIYDCYANSNCHNAKFKIFTVLFWLLCCSVFFYFYYLDVQEVANLALSTEYPGERKLLGGNIQIERYFSGFYDIFYSEDRFPKCYGNVCESSSFFLLYPFFIPILVLSLIKKEYHIDYRIWIVLVYIVLITIWMLYGFSPEIAHATLFERVPAGRAFLGLGVANILMTILIFKWMQDGNITFKYRLVYYAFIFIILSSLGLMMRGADPSFYSYRVIAISSIIFTFVLFTIFEQRLKLFIAAMLLISIPNFFVNPIQYGMPQFKEKELSKFIKNNYFLKENWLAYGNTVVPMYLKSQGLNVINGVNFLPNFNRLNILDRKHQYSKIYNRYAHITAQPLFEEKSKIKFKLVAPDAYEVFINPCSDEIKKLNIGYFVVPKDYFESMQNIKGCTLRLLNKVPLNNLYIFQRM